MKKKKEYGALKFVFFLTHIEIGLLCRCRTDLSLGGLNV